VPIVVLLLPPVFVVLAAIALLPLSLVQRYRVGMARRPARGWFIALNLVAIIVSTVLFLVAAALATVWVPDALSFTLIGLAAGCLLGMLGLALTRWEPTASALYYTPNAPLVFLVTMLVTARVLYGVWRSWHVWSAGLDSWSAAFGVAQSMAAGAVVLGYYLAHWLGVRRRFNRFQRTGRRGTMPPRPV
jgi:hypothetical protein